MNKVSKAIRLTKIAISDAFDPKSVFGVNKVRAVIYGFLGYLENINKSRVVIKVFTSIKSGITLCEIFYFYFIHNKVI